MCTSILGSYSQLSIDWTGKEQPLEMNTELPTFPQTFKFLCGVPSLLSSGSFFFFPLFFFLFVSFPFARSEPTANFPQSHLCQSSLIQKQGSKQGLRVEIKHWSALGREKGKSFTRALTVLEGGTKFLGISGFFPFSLIELLFASDGSPVVCSLSTVRFLL